jgi:hypothetical protein
VLVTKRYVPGFAKHVVYGSHCLSVKQHVVLRLGLQCFVVFVLNRTNYKVMDRGIHVIYRVDRHAPKLFLPSSVAFSILVSSLLEGVRTLES